MNKELEGFPTLEEIRKEYPNPMTSSDNGLLVDEWKDSLPEDKKTSSYIGDGIDDEVETDELYTQCNYCVGGALQMALGETAPSMIDDWRDGIFPRTGELATTLHYFFNFPYASIMDNLNPSEFKCPIPKHDNKECLITDGSDETVYVRKAGELAELDTAWSLASTIIEANDSGRFEEAWAYIGVALKQGGLK